MIGRLLHALEPIVSSVSFTVDSYTHGYVTEATEHFEDFRIGHPITKASIRSTGQVPSVARCMAV